MGRSVLAVGLVLLFAVPAAAERAPRFERASHLNRSSWVLWSPYTDAVAARINTETGGFVPIDVSGFYHPWCFHPVQGAPSQGGWLYALSLRRDGDVDLARIRLEGGGSPEVMRVYRQNETSSVANMLRPGPGGTMVTGVERDGEWWLELLDPLTAAVVQQVGPLPEQPRDAVPWNQGRWLILDHSRVWSWPDEQVWFYSTQGAPERWDEPPRIPRWGWPESLLLLSDTHLLAGASTRLFEFEGDFEALVASSHSPPGADVDVPCVEAPVGYLGPPTRAGTRLFVWDRGGQRLLRLHEHPKQWKWVFQTMYDGDPGAEDRTGEPHYWWDVPDLPQTVDEVLESWAGMPWVDLEGETPASFLLNRRHEMYVLASHLDEAVPKLLEQRSPGAALALSLLEVEAADPWLRELVMDPTQYGWETGCTYPTSSIGIAALEQLHRSPVHELIKLKAGERRELRKAVEAADQLEGMDRWCGEGGYARHLLEAFEQP